MKKNVKAFLAGVIVAVVVGWIVSLVVKTDDIKVITQDELQTTYSTEVK